jgi:EAL domain-containing protein (putative c-di-GMP-specific phosphodiesterase class I)
MAFRPMITGAVSPPTRTATPSPVSKGRILLVDDDEDVARSISRALRMSAFEVVTAGDGQQASQRLAEKTFDAVISDISMPGMTGIDLLKVVRQTDLDVPVVLMTGRPSIDTATRAIQLGVIGYLIKPVEINELIGTIERAVQLNRLARIKREALEYLNSTGDWIGDRAGLEVQFASACETLWMAYQPIISWSRKAIVAYEALVRPTHPALPHPGALIGAAERLGRLHQLGRQLRDNVAATVSQAPQLPQVFVNIHASDLNDEHLLNEDSPLSRMASRVCLEITERSALDGVSDVVARIARLRKLGFRVVIDDLGAGYSGLTSFAQLQPDMVKIDMSLVRNVDREPTKERLIRSLAALGNEMNIGVVCEGVETAAERDALVRVGCDLFQGYHFARPGRPFPPVTF